MKKNLSFILLCLTLICCQQTHQQKPKELVYCKNDNDWYARQKGVTKYLIQIAKGKPESAIVQANQQGKDAEGCFVKALAFAKLNNADSAMHYVRKSIAWGLTTDRYQGLPETLSDLNQFPEFIKWIHKNGKQIVHGPMVGYTTSSSVKYWLRTDQSYKIQFVLSETSDFSSKIFSEKVVSEPGDRFVVKPRVKGLRPSTNYFYKILLDGKSQKQVYSFKTQPEEGKSGDVTIAFGGGAAYIPWHSHMWNTLNKHDLNAMLFLGDNVYIDYPKYFDIQRYCYHRRQSKPEFRKFVSETPVLAIWDDHDFGANDSYGGPEKDIPAWKRPVLKVFKNQFANPYYGGGDEYPGVWFDFRLGDVDFFMLDCRYYREPSSAEGNDKDPQMLGPVQLKWLKKKLLASKGTFKVIVSSVPWAFGAKAGMAGRFDTWRGYKKERKEIFDFLADNKIEGVVLLSADRHRSDLWKIERENSYPLYEMESSKLINTHTHDCMNDPECIFCYNEKCSFGKVIFKTKSPDPLLTYEIWNIDNEKVDEYTIKLSELKH